MAKHKKNKLKGSQTTFWHFATAQIQRKREANKDNTADLYRTTRNWLNIFNRKADLRFRDITPAFVSRFVGFLVEKGLKPNSVKTYFSNLRALYNEADREGLVPHHCENPFQQVNLRKEPGIPRAVDDDVVSRITAVCPEEANLRRTADFCIFCFLACGMAFVDLAHLTPDNIRGNELVYNRHKTGTLIRIGITPGIRTLIDKYHADGSPYLFPVLTSQTTHEGYKSLLRTYNKELEEINYRYLKLDTKLTSYVIRHTWATSAYKKNTPIAVISQALGHTSEKTTRFYLASLDQSEIDKANLIITGHIDRIVAKAG